MTWPHSPWQSVFCAVNNPNPVQINSINVCVNEYIEGHGVPFVTFSVKSSLKQWSHFPELRISINEDDQMISLLDLKVKRQKRIQVYAFLHMMDLKKMSQPEPKVTVLHCRSFYYVYDALKIRVRWHSLNKLVCNVKRVIILIIITIHDNIAPSGRHYQSL